jgi:hypothetical protein
VSSQQHFFPFEKWVRHLSGLPTTLPHSVPHCFPSIYHESQVSHPSPELHEIFEQRIIEMDSKGEGSMGAGSKNSEHYTNQEGQPSHSALPSIESAFTQSNMADLNTTAAAVSPNGVRSSPSPSIPNGKPASPYVKESNPMGANAAQTVSSKDPKAAAAAANDMRNVVRRKLTGYVGFANLPNQWHRKSVRKGFNFNVMVVGMFGGWEAATVARLTCSR